ncbi:MAG: glutamine-hydrolyzing carbamoyl-phosphate synthase small subunit [Christensenellales bacterium]
MPNKILILENGKTFTGDGFGADGTKIAEIVFNTSMVGYQEILSDPSYCGQFVTMSYPLIGNYGLTDEDYESKGIYMSGFIVREYNDMPSNFRYTMTLQEMMQTNGVVGISGVDTRELVRIIRDEGSQRAMITDIDADVDECVKILKATPYETEQVKTVSTKRIWHCRTQNPKFTVVAVDCGIKYNIIRKFNECGINVIVVPYNTSAEEISRLNPDGLFLSNGPGDPENVPEVIELVKKMKGRLPIMGICLGHQIIGLSYGAKTYKMKFGHRGANHPVKNLLSGKVEITAQNHSYAIKADSLKGTGLEVTHVNLIDGEVEGMIDEKNRVISIQYHPESAAGPEDSGYIFRMFLKNLEAVAGGKLNAEKNRY